MGTRKLRQAWSWYATQYLKVSCSVPVSNNLLSSLPKADLRTNLLEGIASKPLNFLELCENKQLDRGEKSTLFSVPSL